jgi:hypothetical protein
MAKLSILAGATSQSVNVFIQDSSSTVGAGLSGLVFNTSGLIAYYSFTGANTTSVQIALATLSLVTSAFSSGGFKEIDATNMKGLYRLDLPNTALAASKGRVCTVILSGAANMAPCVLEIELTAVDNQSTAFGLSLAKTTNITGLNDIAASAVVSSGAITTSGGAVSTVTTVTNQLTAAAIATGVWQDAVSGDFTTASSIGKALYIANVVPGAAGGHFIAGTNAATTITTGLTTTFTGNLTGSVASVTGAVGSVTGAVGSVTGAVGSIASGGITRASLAADTGLQPIRSNTAAAGSGTTITLDAGASATNSFYNNDLILLTGGTGAGQARFISAYVGSTQVATVATWATNPDNTTTFAILPFDAVAGATAPTTAQIATAVWTDLLSSSDFSTVASVGKLLKDDIDAAVSSRMATYTQPTGFLAATFPSGTVANTTNITAATGLDITKILGTAISAPATAGILDVNVKNMNNVAGTAITTIKAVQGLTTADTIATYTGNTPQTGDSFARIGSTGSGLTSLATPTNITAGTITTVTNLTNAPTAGDFTATMKTSIGTAVAASAVASVTAPVAITSNRKKASTATFEFLMQDATTGAPKTGLTVASVISKDGGAAASTANSVTEIGVGQYQIVLTGTEMTANNIFLQFTATGAITYSLSVQTQP